MIKGNFKIKKIEQNDENLEEREFEQLIERSGAGSHMVFRSKNDDEEFFIDEL
mgnify:CR=1 FL=1|jgi:hypothetical protein